jgi:hypothetical protein
MRTFQTLAPKFQPEFAVDSFDELQKMIACYAIPDLDSLLTILCSPNEVFDGRTNVWDRIFELLFKGT